MFHKLHVVADIFKCQLFYNVVIMKYSLIVCGHCVYGLSPLRNSPRLLFS